MSIKIIVACQVDGGIGFQNTIPWHVSADMRRFKRVTMGHIVIVGRNTWYTLPGEGRFKLPGRRVIVVSSDTTLDAEVYQSLDQAVEAAKSQPHLDVFIAGGGQLYREAITKDYVQEVDITFINKAQTKCDTFFPLAELSEKFQETESVNSNACTFHTFKKKTLGEPRQ